MTYEAGSENLAITVEAKENGFVAMRIYNSITQQYLLGIALPPESASQIAQKLALAAWEIEDREKNAGGS